MQAIAAASAAADPRCLDRRLCHSRFLASLIGDAVSAAVHLVTMGAVFDHEASTRLVRHQRLQPEQTPMMRFLMKLTVALDELVNTPPVVFQIVDKEVAI